MSTAPSPSTTTTSSGNTATPPQPIGSCQPTKVSPATEGGAEVPWHHTGSPVPSTPATSRTTPSLTSAATPRLLMRAQRMSPKMPASMMPIASTTAMPPSGIASIAARVEFGEPQDAGVARSSRAGTKRKVKARPTRRLPRPPRPAAWRRGSRRCAGLSSGAPWSWSRSSPTRGRASSRRPGEADRWRSSQEGLKRRERDCAVSPWRPRAPGLAASARRGLRTRMRRYLHSQETSMQRTSRSRRSVLAVLAGGAASVALPALAQSSAFPSRRSP